MSRQAILDIAGAIVDRVREDGPTPTSESYANVAAVAGAFEAITRLVAERFGKRDASPDI